MQKGLKKAMRSLIADRIKGISMDRRREQSEMICCHLLPRLLQQHHVGVYLAMPDEVDLSPMFKDLLQNGVHLYVPHVDGVEMRFVPLPPLDHLTPQHTPFTSSSSSSSSSSFSSPSLSLHPLGFLQPTLSEPCLHSSSSSQHEPCLDVLIVPGRAFDGLRNRLGRGKGYYDRYMRCHSSTRHVAVAFNEQHVDDVPIDQYDVKVDEVIYPNKQH